jgi:hypothetical protein
MNTYTGVIDHIEQYERRHDGTLTFRINDLESDVAILIQTP